jgi:PAS domain S-box-containing protein
LTDRNWAILDDIGALVVVLDLEGKIVHWNKACTELTGYTLEEARGRAPWEFLLVSEEAEAVRSEFARVSTEELAGQLENYWIGKNAERHWISWSNTICRGSAGEAEYIIATGIDRTEQKNAREALQISEAKMRGILSTAADAIIAVNDEQKIVIYNEGAEEIFGWSPDDVLGRSLDVLIPERFQHSHHRHVQAFGSGPDHSRRMGKRGASISGVRKSGEEFPAEAAISVLEVDDTRLFTVILRDLTERKKLVQSLRREIQTRDELTRTIVHDLRNPLNSISLQAQLIARRTTTEKCQTAAASIKKSASRMSGLLEDLLDVARLEEGRLAVEKTQMEPARLVREVVEATRPIASQSGITMEVEIDPHLPTIEADRARLMQVLDNLIGNALKFTPEGGRVTVRARVEAEGEVHFCVVDTGPGIPSDHIERLFEPFWQANGADRRGAGLGLTIAKGIVESHGGRFLVTSIVGRGTDFCFEVPTE